MILNFIDTLRDLHSRHPDGCLCLEYKWLCVGENKELYKFCKLNIESRLDVNDIKCIKDSKDIKPDLCFILNKKNLDILHEELADSKEEVFYGSIAYYSGNGELLFCAINFIDDVMEPEVLRSNIGIGEA